MTLKKYHVKRNFQLTPEPYGKRKKSSAEKIFVVQKHAASHLHYDFRLALQGVLISWAVPKGPCLDPNVKRLAMHVEDHPLEYGSFEGIIPKGQYGGGTVMLWDQGEWISDDANPVAAYHKGRLSFILNGEKLKGRWKLIRINKDDKTWLLIKAKDQYAKPLKNYDITAEEPNSVLTGQSIKEIAENDPNVWGKKGLEKSAKKKLSKSTLNSLLSQLKPSAFPRKISPELATLVDEPPKGEEWLHEIKLDGYRLIVFKRKGKTTLVTRRHHDWTDKFPAIATAFNKLPIETAIFDGEIVVLDENQHSDFQLLQNSIKEGQGNPFIFYIFDLLYLDKYNLCQLPLIKRKKLLRQILPIDQPTLRFSDHVVGSGKDVFNKACELALEGIVSKNANSLYTQKRTSDWLKIKCVKRQEFVIGGFTNPRKSRKFFGALLVGTYNEKRELIYHGRVGTGFTDTSLKSLHQALLKHLSPTMPFNKQPPASRGVNWVKPLLVAEIEFTEWTEEGFLRHPSFKGLRNDKLAKTIRREDPISTSITASKEPVKMKTKKNAAVTLTNPNKILYPEDNITKQDVFDYYDQIQSWILPYIINRPLTLVRCPEGYQSCFYQKHINNTTPAELLGITIKEKESHEVCIYIKDKNGLLALPQMGTLEIHPWGSTIKKVEYPDIIIFDLDPAPDVTWKKVVSAALEVKKQLAQFKLKSFVKTTGGKGLHVVIPIKPEYAWDDIKKFAQTFADFLTMQHPNDYIDKMTKVKRKGKIFIDYLRNQRGATAIAPYSTRARQHAPVATPLHWDELTDNHADTIFTIKTLPDRLATLKKDPWKDFFKIRQSLHLIDYKK